MPVTPHARRRAQEAADRAVAAQKAEYRARLERLQRAFDPPLSNSELAAGFELPVAADGEAGGSAVGRWKSSAPRLRNARPDSLHRALIDDLLAGELFLAAQEAPMLGMRRPVLVCEARDVPWLAGDWEVVNLGGRPIPPRRGAEEQAWEDDGVWDLFEADAPTRRAPRVAEPPSPAPSTPADAGPPTDRILVAGFSVPRLGYGTMRLATGSLDEAQAVRRVWEALDAGVRFLDTADVYCRGPDDLHRGERILTRALAQWGDARDEVLVATKGGLTRPAARWVPDGRPEHLKEACEGSLRALELDALPLYQLHAVDRRVPFAEQVGALARLREEGKVRHVGLCNVSVEQLDEALQVVPIASVQVAASRWEASPLHEGLLGRCRELGIPLVAHSPLGGHRRRERPLKDRAVQQVARRLGVSPQRVALAWLLSLDPALLVIPGASTEEHLRDTLGAATLALSDEDLDLLDQRRPWASELRRGARLPEEVVVVMGTPAAGKSTFVEPLLRRGYARLNRDEAGGRLDDLLPALRAELSAGRRAVVLDNTYPSRTSRVGVLRVAAEQGVPVRCVHLEVPLGDAMVNACSRMLDRCGRLLDPEEMKEASRRDPNLFPPDALVAYRRRYEAPTRDEGFAAVEVVPFARREPEEARRRGLLLDVDGTLRVTRSGAPFPVEPGDVVLRPGVRDRLADCAAEGWVLVGISNQAGIAQGRLSAEQARACFDRTLELLGLEFPVLFCPHPAGRIRCWCRKPMPGLGVRALREHGLDRRRSLMVGDLESDRAFAAHLGVRFEDAERFFAPDYSTVSE